MMSGRTRRKKLTRTRRLSREESDATLTPFPATEVDVEATVGQRRQPDEDEEKVSCLRSAGLFHRDESEIKNVTCQQQQQQQQQQHLQQQQPQPGCETDDFGTESDVHVVVVAGHDDEVQGEDHDDDDDDVNKDREECFSSSDDRQTVVQATEQTDSNNINNNSNNRESEFEQQSKSWASLIDEEEEGEGVEVVQADQQQEVVEEQVTEVLPTRATTLLFKSFALGPPSWRAMGDAAGKNCGASATGSSLIQNPKWRRAAVRAVQIQETQKQTQLPSFTVAGNHVASKGHTGNGGIGFDVIPPPPILPGGIPQPPPPPTILPPGPWGDPSCVFTLESSSSNRHHGYDTDSTEHSSSHSSVLVDMGKVVGVLRSSHQAPRSSHQSENKSANDLDNNEDEDDDDDDDDEEIDEEVPDLDTVNENAEPSTAESMVLAARTGGGCASCAAAAAAGGGKSPKPGSGDLDDSLCGDPLMYATFVAPVHQYSTETEPSRQTSFNYPSRQPSFKQNSSEAEPQGDYGYQQQQPQSFLGGQLPVPRCSSSGSADYERSDDIRDIYEEVPTIDRWPLPPLPHHEDSSRDSAEVCSVEVSQEELEQQLHMERMSFMSGSSANEEEEEEMYDEKDNSIALPPPPPPPAKSAMLHLGQPYRCRSNRELTPNVRDLSPNSNATYEPYRPVSSSGGGSSSMLTRQWFSAEDSDGADVTSAGTVRRKAKRERNKTATGVMTTTTNTDNSNEVNNSGASASVSPARVASNNKNNSVKRAKPTRNKCPAESNFPPPPTPPPPVPPHQIYYKSHTVLDQATARPGGLSSHHVGRLASPDQFSESSASFHENEFISHDPQPQQQQQQQKRTHQNLQQQQQRCSDNNVTAEVHHHMQQQQQQQQRRGHPHQMQRRRTPPPPQFSNRDSVRESWMSSGSECQGSSGSPYGGSGGGNADDPKGVHHHHHHVSHHHYIQHHQQQQQQQQQSRSAIDWHATPTNQTRGTNRSHRDLLATTGQQQFSKLVSPLASSITLPRPSRSVGNLTSAVASSTGVTPSPPTSTGAQGRPTVHYNTSSRSLSRESGSSSSRAGSRTDQPSKAAVGGVINRPAHIANIRKQHARSHETQEGHCGCPSSTSLPGWLSQPPVGVADATELEAMALPSSDANSIALKEEALLANFHQRFKKDYIYTYLGTVVVSINPYKKLPLYSPEVIDVYRCHCLYELPPHIYAVTDRAWRSLRDMNTDQCVIMTGESGAGKTEASKLVLQYLAAVTGNAKEFHNIKYQLLQSNSVLEAFGNAKTRLNDNSSRFGKYTEVSFDFKGDPTGGLINNFLLEKSRVTRHSAGERNFHIFYQLIAGADLQLLKELRLQRNPDNYALLRRYDVTSSSGSPASSASVTTASCSISSNAAMQQQTVPGPPGPSLQQTQASSTLSLSASDSLDDRRDFLITKKAMEDLGLSADEIHDVFSLVGAVLKLGNITFVPTTNMDGTEGCVISNDYEVYDASHNLRTKPDKLVQVLLTRTIRIPKSESGKTQEELYDVCEILHGEFGMMQSGLTSRSVEMKNSDYLVTDLSAGEAAAARDALCRTIYSRLFTWIVGRINESIKVKTPRKHRSMGILDMYGFESGASERNGFEQLVINFANEKMQQVITEWTLHAEQEEYTLEAIEWTHLDYFSNAGIVALIERGSYGIFSVLDEVCSMQHPDMPTLSASPYSAVSAAVSASAAASLLLGANPPDEVFLDRLAERFSQHPHIEVGGRPSSSATTTTTTTTSGAVGDDDDDNGDDRGRGDDDEDDKACIDDKQLHQHCFRIKHYAGAVVYDCRDFVSRNLDTLDRDLSQAMYECNHSLLKILFPEGNPRRATRRRPTTAGTQFKISLGALVNNLSTKSPHFVRCIKPNEMKQPRRFDVPLVQHQISYLGLVETSLLRRHGYVFRMEYEQFLHRYKMLSSHTWPHWHGGGSVDGVTCLLRDLPISASEYAFGRTKIFIRTSRTFEILEELRRERIDELATLIQKTYRGHVNRQKWHRLRGSQIIISSYWKKWKDKSNIIEMKQRRKEEWAATTIQRCYRSCQRRRYLIRLAHSLPSESPLSKEWPAAPARFLREANIMLRKLYHKWRCYRYRLRFDQIARNRMREKVTASIIFKDRKASYRKSVMIPFRGDYVNLRRMPEWREALRLNRLYHSDRFVVFADVVNEMYKPNAKFVPILFVISTSSMLVMDQRTMQIKYRIPASDIFKLSLSPFSDDIAVFHVRATSPTRETRSQANSNIPGCLSSSADSNSRRKGDFVLQTGHVIEIVTKLFLVVQNATGKPPLVNISHEFEANFGSESVTFAFKKSSSSSSTAATSHHHGHHGGEGVQQVKLVKKSNRMEIFL